jgi:ferrous iron transport protein B
MTREIRIALTGNPNVGKTTLFNALTGSRQHVGNWPGVTVEKKTGRVRRNGYEIEVVDLPGTYSLTAYSADEIIARDFLLDEKPDVVVQVVDATNLERNLYLTTQLSELQVPVVIALNMAEAQGDTVDRARLSACLEVPVVCMTGIQGDELNDLLDAVIKEAETSPRHGRIVDFVDYGEGLEATIATLVDALAIDASLPGRYPLRWLAVKLLEGDEDVASKVRESPAFACVQALLASVSSDEYGIVMADRRCEAIAAIDLQVRGTNAGLLDSIGYLDDVLYPCSGSPCCCGETGGEGVVTYALTERGRRFAERLREQRTFAGVRGRD